MENLKSCNNGFGYELIEVVPKIYLKNEERFQGFYYKLTTLPYLW